MNKSTAKLSQKENAAIEEGLKSMKAGKGKSHNEVMKETKAKFPQLFK